MRKTLILSLVLFLAAVFAYAQAPAATTGTAASTPAATTPATGAAKTTHHAAAGKSYSGTIASVDAAGKSFVVHPAKGADMTVKVNDKTKYYPKGKTWDDVKADAKVHGKYKVDGADNWATTVDFPAAKAPKADAKAATPPAKTGK
jgi:hypothetical protein